MGPGRVITRSWPVRFLLALIAPPGRWSFARVPDAPPPRRRTRDAGGSMAALEHGAGSRLSGAAHGTRQISVNRSMAPATTQRVLERAAKCGAAMYPANLAQRGRWC